MSISRLDSFIVHRDISMEVRFVVYVNTACPLVYSTDMPPMPHNESTEDASVSIHSEAIEVRRMIPGRGIWRWTPYARIHTTLCGEWTQGRGESPGGYWLGPFGYEEAVHVARATGLFVVRCNLLLKFLKGEVRDRSPGYKARDLHLLAVEGCRLRTILTFPSGIDVIFEYPAISKGEVRPANIWLSGM